MKIAIVGFGKFGKELTELLVHENHNITVIDNKPSIIEDAVNQYDVMGYVGNGASYQTLLNADLKKADVLIDKVMGEATAGMPIPQ